MQHIRSLLFSVFMFIASLSFAAEENAHKELIFITSEYCPFCEAWEQDIGSLYHRTTYDYDSLSTLMESLSLTGIQKYDWRNTSHANFDDHSQAYIPHMDKENGVLVSLNVQGVKQ